MTRKGENTPGAEIHRRNLVCPFGLKINLGNDVLVLEAQSCNFKVKIAACHHAAGGKQELGFPQGKSLLPACSHNWAQTDPVPSCLLLHSAFPFCQLAGSTWGRCANFFLFHPTFLFLRLAEMSSCCTWRSPAGRTGGRSAAGSSSGPGCRTSSCPGSASGWPRRACSPSPLRHRRHAFTVRARGRTGWRGQTSHNKQQQQQVGQGTSCCDLTAVSPELDL